MTRFFVTVSKATALNLIALVTEFVTNANYAHSEKRSRVVSVRSAFTQLLGSLLRLDKEADNTFDGNMHTLSAAVANGNVHVPTKLWNRFINSVCNAVGYQDFPTEAEAQEVFNILMEDYVASNEFLTTDILSKEAEIRDIRVKDEFESMPVEEVEEPASTEEVATSAAA